MYYFVNTILGALLFYLVLLLSVGAGEELPTIYQNPQGACIGSKPTGLCYSKSLGEHKVIIIE
jgi:hypothetical protein